MKDLRTNKRTAIFHPASAERCPLGSNKMQYTRNIRSFILEAILVLFIFFKFIYAGNPTSISGYNQKWINLGFGAFNGSRFVGMGGGLSVNYYINKYLISMRLIDAADIFYYPAIPNGNPSIKNLNDISISLGLIKKNKWIYGSVSGGIGLVNDNMRVKLKGDNFTTVGIPLEAQLFITPLAALGLGVNIVGNVNFESSYLGLLLCVQYGILR